MSAPAPGSVELLDAIERMVARTPPERPLRLGEIARRLGLPREAVEPAVIHLVARGAVTFSKNPRPRGTPRRPEKGA